MNLPSFTFCLTMQRNKCVKLLGHLANDELRSLVYLDTSID